MTSSYQLAGISAADPCGVVYCSSDKLLQRDLSPNNMLIERQDSYACGLGVGQNNCSSCKRLLTVVCISLFTLVILNMELTLFLYHIIAALRWPAIAR